MSSTKYSSGLIFTSNGDGTCYLYNGKKARDKDIIIPDVVTRGECRGDKVIAIGESAFEYGGEWGSENKDDDIKNIVIPDSVEIIGEAAFHDFINLKTISIGAGVRKIEKNALYCLLTNIIVSPQNKAFKIIDNSLYTKNGQILVKYVDCESVPDFVLPKTVKSIRERAFDRARLRHIVLSESLSCISEFAFESCRNLECISVPDSIKAIERGTFYACEKLNSVALGNRVTCIKDLAFARCSSLVNVSFSSKIKSLGQNAFGGCESLIELDLPESVETIDRYAFNGCRNLTQIKMPEGVTSICESTFRDCENLVFLELTSNITYIHREAFVNCPKLIIKAPRGSYAIEYANQHNIKFEEI